MKRVRVYNEKGAKFTTTADKAIKNNWVPVEGVELLHRMDLWSRKMENDKGIGVSFEYYSVKRSECFDRLKALRAEGYYIPESTEDLNYDVG